MNWNEHIDNYCERLSAAMWAEPVNAVSNLAFVIAALLLWRMLRPHADVPTSIGFMAPLVTLIGVGSFAFHTLATLWSRVLDVAPIAVFVLCYLASFLRWFYGLAWNRCLLGGVVFVCLAAASGVLAGGQIPNGSGVYFPVLLLMIGLAVALRASRDESRAGYWPAFAGASVVFAGALLVHTVDRAVCGTFPLGTHFLWHVLNGYLLFLVSRALVRRWRSQVDPGRRQPAHSTPLADGLSVPGHHHNL